MRERVWAARGRAATRAFFSANPARFQGVRRRLRVVAEALGFLLLLSFVAGRGAGPWAASFDRLAMAWAAGLLIVAVATYVHEVGVARRLLRDLVTPGPAVDRGALLGIPIASLDDPGGRGAAEEAPADLTIDDYDPLTLRGRSLFRLALAFRAALAGLPSQVEEAVREIDRADLGPWEQRVLEAVRTLSALASGDRQRAARLAPLALETGHPEVDRMVAVALVRAAWNDRERLLAVSRALSLGGRDAAAMSRLAEVRVRDLASANMAGRALREAGAGVSVDAAEQPFDPDTLREISEDAREVGDADLAERLLARAERDGLYR